MKCSSYPKSCEIHSTTNSGIHPKIRRHISDLVSEIRSDYPGVVIIENRKHGKSRTLVIINKLYDRIVCDKKEKTARRILKKAEKITRGMQTFFSSGVKTGRHRTDLGARVETDPGGALRPGRFSGLLDSIYAAIDKRNIVRTALREARRLKSIAEQHEKAKAWANAGFYYKLAANEMEKAAELTKDQCHREDTTLFYGKAILSYEKANELRQTPELLIELAECQLERGRFRHDNEDERTIHTNLQTALTTSADPEGIRARIIALFETLGNGAEAKVMQNVGTPYNQLEAARFAADRYVDAAGYCTTPQRKVLYMQKALESYLMAYEINVTHALDRKKAVMSYGCATKCRNKISEADPALSKSVLAAFVVRITTLAEQLEAQGQTECAANTWQRVATLLQDSERADAILVRSAEMFVACGDYYSAMENYNILLGRLSGPEKEQMESTVEAKFTEEAERQRVRREHSKAADAYHILSIRKAVGTGKSIALTTESERCAALKSAALFAQAGQAGSALSSYSCLIATVSDPEEKTRIIAQAILDLTTSAAEEASQRKYSDAAEMYRCAASLATTAAERSRLYLLAAETQAQAKSRWGKVLYPGAVSQSYEDAANATEDPELKVECLFQAHSWSLPDMHWFSDTTSAKVVSKYAEVLACCPSTIQELMKARIRKVLHDTIKQQTRRKNYGWKEHVSHLWHGLAQFETEPKRKKKALEHSANYLRKTLKEIETRSDEREEKYWRYLGERFEELAEIETNKKAKLRLYNLAAHNFEHARAADAALRIHTKLTRLELLGSGVGLKHASQLLDTAQRSVSNPLVMCKTAIESAPADAKIKSRALKIMERYALQRIKELDQPGKFREETISEVVAVCLESLAISDDAVMADMLRKFQAALRKAGRRDRTGLLDEAVAGFEPDPDKKKQLLLETAEKLQQYDLQWDYESRVYNRTIRLYLLVIELEQDQLKKADHYLTLADYVKTRKHEFQPYRETHYAEARDYEKKALACVDTISGSGIQAGAKEQSLQSLKVHIMRSWQAEAKWHEDQNQYSDAAQLYEAAGDRENALRCNIIVARDPLRGYADAAVGCYTRAIEKAENDLEKARLGLFLAIEYAINGDLSKFREKCAEISGLLESQGRTQDLQAIRAQALACALREAEALKAKNDPRAVRAYSAAVDFEPTAEDKKAHYLAALNLEEIDAEFIKHIFDDAVQIFGNAANVEFVPAVINALERKAEQLRARPLESWDVQEWNRGTEKAKALGRVYHLLATITPDEDREKKKEYFLAEAEAVSGKGIHPGDYNRTRTTHPCVDAYLSAATYETDRNARFAIILNTVRNYVQVGPYKLAKTQLDKLLAEATPGERPGIRQRAKEILGEELTWQQAFVERTGASLRHAGAAEQLSESRARMMELHNFLADMEEDRSGAQRRQHLSQAVEIGLRSSSEYMHATFQLVRELVVIMPTDGMETAEQALEARMIGIVDSERSAPAKKRANFYFFLANWVSSNARKREHFFTAARYFSNADETSSDSASYDSVASCYRMAAAISETREEKLECHVLQGEALMGGGWYDKACHAFNMALGLADGAVERTPLRAKFAGMLLQRVTTTPKSGTTNDFRINAMLYGLALEYLDEGTDKFEETRQLFVVYSVYYNALPHNILDTGHARSMAQSYPALYATLHEIREAMLSEDDKTKYSAALDQTFLEGLGVAMPVAMLLQALELFRAAKNEIGFVPARKHDAVRIMREGTRSWAEASMRFQIGSSDFTTAVSSSQFQVSGILHLVLNETRDWRQETSSKMATAATKLPPYAVLMTMAAAKTVEEIETIAETCERSKELRTSKDARKTVLWYFEDNSKNPEKMAQFHRVLQVSAAGRVVKNVRLLQIVSLLDKSFNLDGVTDQAGFLRSVERVADAFIATHCRNEIVAGRFRERLEEFYANHFLEAILTMYSKYSVEYASVLPLLDIALAAIVMGDFEKIKFPTEKGVKSLTYLDERQQELVLSMNDAFGIFGQAAVTATEREAAMTKAAKTWAASIQVMEAQGEGQDKVAAFQKDLDQRIVDMKFHFTSHIHAEGENIRAAARAAGRDEMAARKEAELEDAFAFSEEYLLLIQSRLATADPKSQEFRKLKQVERLLISVENLAKTNVTEINSTKPQIKSNLNNAHQATKTLFKNFYSFDPEAYESLQAKMDLETLSTLLIEEVAQADLSLLTAYDSADPVHLILAGKEPDNSGSCQRYDGTPSLMIGLLGYLLNSQVKIIRVENQDGIVVGRAMLKIVEADGKPALFLERAYYHNARSDPNIDRAIVSLAAKKAGVMGVPIITTSFAGSSHAKVRVRRSGGLSPYEYSDSIQGSNQTKCEREAEMDVRVIYGARLLLSQPSPVPAD